MAFPYRSESLDSKLKQYEKNREKLDKLAEATGVRKDSETDAVQIQVGEKCQVFSESAGTYVEAQVIALRDRDEEDESAVESAEVQVQYLGADGTERQRWVCLDDATSALAADLEQKILRSVAAKGVGVIQFSERREESGLAADERVLSLGLESAPGWALEERI